MIVVAGEALIDLAPRDELLLPLPGGSPYNVAVGLGRLGVEAAYLGPLSRDRFGELLSTRLAAAGASLQLAPRTDAPTTLAVVHLDDRGRASYGFYLTGTSTGELTVDGLPEFSRDAAVHVSFGAISAEHDPAGPALTALLSGPRRAHFTSLDPNVRPPVIADRRRYAERMDALVAGVDLVKVSDEDLEALHPAHAPEEVAARWARSGPAAVVVTRGEAGALALRADGSRVEVPGEDVEVIDTVGAGDAFTTGLLAHLDARSHLAHAALLALSEADLREALAFAVHVSALTCTRAGSDPPGRDELDPAARPQLDAR